MTRGHARSGLLAVALATVALATVALLLLVGAADGSAASARGTGRAAYAENPDNPLAGGTWGVYTGSADGVYPAYQRSTGAKRSLLAKIALRPRVRWFGGWMTAADASAKLRDYIRTTQAGDPDVLVQL